MGNWNPKLDLGQMPVKAVKIPSQEEMEAEEFNSVTTKKQVIQAPNTQIEFAKTANTFVQIDRSIRIPLGEVPPTNLNFTKYAVRIEPNYICNRIIFSYSSFANDPKTKLVFSFNAPNPVLDETSNKFRYHGFLLGENPNFLTVDINPHKPIIFVTPFNPDGLTANQVIPFSILFCNLLK